MHAISCDECDLLHTVPSLTEQGVARCVRCGSVLLRVKSDSINRTLAWTTSALILFTVAITFPFLAMKSGGLERHTDLLTGIHEIYRQGMVGLALLVLLTCVLVPLLQMLGLLYVFVPLHFNRTLRFAIPVFRAYQHIQPWSMMEVFMLGILVSWVKLGKMATIVPGVAVFAFGLLIFALTCAVSAVDTQLVWERIEELTDG